MNKIDYKKIPLDGVLDSPIDLRDYNYKDFCCSNSQDTIPDEDEVQYPFNPRNQLNTSTCAFQSVTAIMETINDVNDYLSEGFLNAMRSKCDDVGINKGAYTRDVMRLACKVGAIPKVDFSNLEDYPEIEKSFNSLSNCDELIVKAKDLKCKSYVKVDVEDIPMYIHNERKSLIFTVRLYESFYKVNYPSTDGIVPYPSKGKRCGNHAMVCVGYKYVGKKLYLKILNSWGKYWCLGGYCWINAEDLELINEVWGFTDLPKRKSGSKYKIGWDKDKTTGKWIYSEDGKTLFKDGWKQINNIWYYFRNTFVLDGEWLKENNSWYYFEPASCNMAQNKWILYNTKWYRFGQDGKMLIEWFRNEHGEWFYLDIDKGYAYTGWVYIHGKYYYFNKDCVMQTGWIKDKDGKWFYLNPVSNGYRGAMYTEGTYTIDGKQYEFDKEGMWIEYNSLVSDGCINFIKSWEGFSATPYYDEVGVLTLGYGMTGNEIKGLSSITESQASQMLKELVNNKYAKAIKKDLDSKGITLTQNEFDALISFAYNCGTAGLLGSTLYKNVVAGIRDKNTIISNFQAWSNGGGRRIEGLFRRRTKEAAMFLSADYTGNN